MPASDEYRSDVRDVFDSPVPLGDGDSAGAADRCIQVEVFFTGASSTTPNAAKKAAVARFVGEHADPHDPLRATLQNVSIPITTDAT